MPFNFFKKKVPKPIEEKVESPSSNWNSFEKQKASPSRSGKRRIIYM